MFMPDESLGEFICKFFKGLGIDIDTVACVSGLEFMVFGVIFILLFSFLILSVVRGEEK